MPLQNRRFSLSISLLPSPFLSLSYILLLYGFGPFKGCISRRSRYNDRRKRRRGYEPTFYDRRISSVSCFPLMGIFTKPETRVYTARKIRLSTSPLVSATRRSYVRSARCSSATRKSGQSVSLSADKFRRSMACYSGLWNASILLSDATRFYSPGDLDSSGLKRTISRLSRRSG